LKIGIILTPDSRSRAYLQKIHKENKKFDTIIFMNDDRQVDNYSEEQVKQSKNYGFDVSISVKKNLLKNNFIFKEFKFVDINHIELIEFLKKIPPHFFIFSGGGILKSEILNLKHKFIHLHPGLVPKYRGSTCFYYSLINEGNCSVTAFFMDKKLDTGDIILQKTFPKPNHIFIDEIYDSHIRSETLIELLNKKILESKNKIRKQNPSEGETYYIIHPVLKHIAILSCTR